MPYTCLDAGADSGSIENALDTWEAGDGTGLTVNDIEITKIGPNRVVITINHG